MLEGAHHGDEVALRFVVLVQVPEIHIQQRVAVGEEERFVHAAFQQAQPAAGAHEHVLVHKLHLIVLFQVPEIAFDHAPLVIHDEGEFPAAEVPEPVNDEFRDGLLPHRDERLGQNFGVGVQPGAQAAGHHDHRDARLLAVVHVQTVGKHDVRDAAPLIQNGQRINAAGFQHLFGAATLGNGQAFGVMVGRLLHGGVQRAAPQEKLADIPVGHHGLQFALRRQKQDALAGLIQLAHGFQHGGLGGNDEFLNFQHGGSSLYSSASTASMTRWQSASLRLVEQGRLTM